MKAGIELLSIVVLSNNTKLSNDLICVSLKFRSVYLTTSPAGAPTTPRAAIV